MNSSMNAGMSAFMIVLIVVIVLLMYVLTSFLLSRIFKKAGVEGWKAWVPVYNNWILFELGGQKGYWAVLTLVPVVNIVATVFMFIAMYHIGLKLGKEGAFVLLAIFLPLVWMAWLAFDKSTWQGGAPVPATAASAPTVPPTNNNPTPPTV